VDLLFHNPKSLGFDLLFTMLGHQMSPQDFCQDGWKAKEKKFLPGNSRRNGFGIAFFTRIVQLVWFSLP